ncbi:hypothetical protein [Streptomyces cinnamoneus]|nr:hypothetical protein [Streptomyces cinnamoneus]
MHDAVIEDSRRTDGSKVRERYRFGTWPDFDSRSRTTLTARGI